MRLIIELLVFISLVAYALFAASVVCLVLLDNIPGNLYLILILLAFVLFCVYVIAYLVLN